MKPIEEVILTLLLLVGLGFWFAYAIIPQKVEFNQEEAARVLIDACDRTFGNAEKCISLLKQGASISP